jgi:hypothetical protein
VPPERPLTSVLVLLPVLLVLAFRPVVRGLELLLLPLVVLLWSAQSSVPGRAG